MDSAVAQQCLRENENAVLATWQHDGRLQMSPVTVGLVAAGRVIIRQSRNHLQSTGISAAIRVPSCTSSSRPLPALGCRWRAPPRW